MLEFGLVRRILEQIVDLLIETSDRFGSRATLGSHADIDQSWMVISSPDASTYRVGQRLLRTQVLEQARRKTAAEDLIHHADCEIIGIIAPDSDADHRDLALVHIGFLGKIDAWLRT